jgi:hypothetical protein
MGWFGKKEEVKQEEVKQEQQKPVETQKSQSSSSEHEETINERKVWQMKNIFIAFWLFVLFIVIAVVSVGLFPSMNDFTNRVILWTVLVIIYAIILFFLLEPGLLREVNRKEYQTIEKQVTVEKPVYQTIEKPVVKEVIKEVIKEVPVVKEVIKEVPVVREVEKPVYYPVQKPKLDIPRYDYIASVQTKKYHTNNCRLGKSIKRGYKEFSNNPADFTRKGYAPCKFCITKEVKV